MYTRQGESYQLSDEAVGRILDDQANPLRVVCNLINTDSSVLDVGAGNGVLARLLQRLGKSVVIDGIEPDHSAAILASSYYNSFVEGTLADAFSNVQGNPENLYDYIVLADVIEHTVNPLSFLQDVSPHLASKGNLLVSVPNISFAPIRAELMSGAWEYTDWGIIERTHLRFFSKSGLVKTLENAGYTVECIYHLGRSPFRMEKQLQNYNVNPLSLLQLKSDPLAFTYQLLAVCSHASDHSFGQAIREEWIEINNEEFMRTYYRLRRSNQRHK